MFLNGGSNVAVKAKGESITYNQLIQHVNLFSKQYHISKNDRVLIFSENRIGWIFAFYSVWLKNGIAVPVDAMSTAKEIAYIINDCTPSQIICSSNLNNTLYEALEQTAQKIPIRVIDDFENKDAQLEPTTYNHSFNKSDTAVIIYTSGTTGKPKGVMLSFDNLLVNIHAVTQEIKIISGKERLMILLPVHHILPLMGTIVIPFKVGAQVAISPTLSSDDIIQTLQENKISIIIGVPRLYHAIYNGIQDKINASFIAKTLFKTAGLINNYGFSRFIFKSVHKKFGGYIKYMVCGGAALDKNAAVGYKTLGFEVLEGYGMTETAPIISFNRPGKVKPGTVGTVLSTCEVKILDTEVIVKGPNVMQGYYNKPDETSDIIKNGWLHTGDIGHFDSQGFLTLTGRKKEIIVLSNGKNINPSEIEETLLLSNPVIKEVGVFHVNDILQAIVVPNKQNFEAINKSIFDYLKQDVFIPYNESSVPYKRVMNFVISNEELPKTQLGKIKRYQLAAVAESLKEQKKQAPKVDLEEYNIIADYIQKEKKLEVSPSDHLEMDLGLDSLDKVSLQVFIESTFGFNLDISEIIKFENILELSKYVKKHRTSLKVEKINWSAILKEKVHLQLPKSWFTGRFLIKLFKIFFKFYFRYKTKGAENIPNEPCIIAPNHQSFFDPLFVAGPLKIKQLRNTYFYAKEKHIKREWIKFLASANNVIIMDINNNLKESIQKMAMALKAKKNIIIFPEGTRTKTGQLGEFKKTFAILSKELNIPIVPVNIKGAFKALPSGSLFPKPFTKVQVEFLKPIYPVDLNYDNITLRVLEQIRSVS